MDRAERRMGTCALKQSARMAVIASFLGVCVALLVRSNAHRDVMSTACCGINVDLLSYLGGIHVKTTTDWSFGDHAEAESVDLKKEISQSGELPYWDDQYPAPTRKLQLLGFGYVAGYNNLNPEDNGLPWMPYHVVVVPYWFVAIASTLFILPWAWCRQQSV